MPKSVNVIINSKNLISGNTQQANYFVDWKAIINPHKKYWLHFVYMGGANTYTGTKFPLLCANFNTNNYQISSNTNNNQLSSNATSKSQVLGVLMPTVLVGSSNSCFFQSLDNTNLPIFLDSPPLNNNFTISILDNSGALFLDNNASPANPADYVLILKFTEYDDDENI